MAKKTIGLGTTANDHAGDSLRVAGGKLNDNFNEIYTALGNGTVLTVADVAKSGAYEDLIGKPNINGFNIVSVPSSLTSPGSPRDVAIGAIDNINYLFVCVATDSWKIIPLRDDPVVLVGAPSHAYGRLGDRRGLIATDNDNLYVCLSNYVDNTTDIWKTIPWGGVDGGVQTRIRYADSGVFINEPNGDVQVVTDDNKTWTFKVNGDLELPQESTLRDSDGNDLLANTSINYSGPLYVVANVDGKIVYSTDGNTFSEAFNTGLNTIGTVAVGPDKLVFSLLDVNADADVPGLYITSSPTIRPTLISGTDGSGDYYWAQVQYFPDAPTPWVAVGCSTSGSPLAPMVAYSSNGTSWTTRTVDSTYIASHFTDNSDLRFTDIIYKNGGWLISADRNVDENGEIGGGLWWTTDITTQLTEENHIAVNASFKTVEAFNFSFGGQWVAFSKGDTTWWSNNSEVPTVTEDWSSFYNITTAVIAAQTGLTNIDAQETTSGTTTLSDGGEGNVEIWAVSTGSGHVVFWPNAPVDPIVTLPQPYTTTVTSITNATTAVISYSGGVNQSGAIEKVTITGSSVTNYNGTYFINRDTNEMFLDVILETPFDTSGFASFTGEATLTWSHGEYIDALGFANGYLYAANDDEQVFKGELTDFDVITWTKIDDKNNSLAYWNDLSYIDQYTGVLTLSSVNTGDITFNGVQITGQSSGPYSGLIELIPAVSVGSGEGQHNFLDNGQYLRIYPTTNFDAPHIHIAAGEGMGGTGDLFLGDDNKYVQVSGDGIVSIRTNTEGLSAEWVFLPDGTMVLPYQYSSDRTGTGENLQFVKSNNQKIISTRNGTLDNPTVERIVISGGDSYQDPDTGAYNGEGGDVYLWAGRGVDGGDIKLDAGNSQGDNGYGGYVKMRAGDAYVLDGHGGFLEFRAGGGQSTGGDIDFFAGYGAASSGTIQLHTFSPGTGTQRDWTFGTDGSLTFPDNTVQTTAYKIGEDVITLDGITTSFSPSTVKSLLSITAGIGYFGSDAFTISLPQGVAGQRLVVLNRSSNCAATINDYIVLNPASSIEVIYSAFDGEWVLI